MTRAYVHNIHSYVHNIPDGVGFRDIYSLKFEMK